MGRARMGSGIDCLIAKAQVSEVSRKSADQKFCSIYVPPAGFEPALTAPEAAVASWRILLLTSWDAAGASAHSAERSVHVPDHGPCCMAPGFESCSGN
jgi:hypothetical protein